MARPRLLGLIAALVMRRADREFVLGDLEELYTRRAAERGRLHATAAYLWDALRSALSRRSPGAQPQGRPVVGGPSGRFPRGVADDARLAVRALTRQPRLALVIAFTLAVGIGPVAAVFGMVNQLILSPLPGVPDTDRAAYLQFGPLGRNQGITLQDFDEIRRQATLTEGMASYGNISTIVSVDGGRPQYVAGGTVYGDYFGILGARPADGRLLTAEDTELGANPNVVVLSESLRDRLFGEGAEVVGRTLSVNDQPTEIIGIAGDGFRGPERSGITEAWVPFGALVTMVGFTEERLRSRESTMHGSLLVRPRLGVSPADVEQQMSALMARQAEAIGEDGAYLLERPPHVYAGLHTEPIARVSTNQILRMMGWAVGLILVIACMNAANLLLFRNLTRRGSFATFRALGASTGRIARQQLAESAVLGLLGGLGGIAVAWLVTWLFRGEQLVRMPVFEPFALGWDTAGFITVLTVGTTLVFGVVPGVLAGRFDLGGVLRTSRARETGRLGLLRTTLCACQVALTLALVVGGLLMVRTMSNLRGLDTGLDAQNVFSATLLFRAPPGTPSETHEGERALVRAVEAIPGVERAALDLYGPHGSMRVARVGIPGALPPGQTGGLESQTMVWQVSPGWFDLFGVAPIAGRTFTDDEWRVPSAGGAVLTESLARRVYGDTDVIGRPFWVRGAQPPERTVIGVVGDYVAVNRPGAPTDAVFLPHGDLGAERQLSVLAKVDPDVPGVQGAIAEAVQAVFPAAPVAELVPIVDRVERILREERMLGRLFGLLSVFGVTMSALGLYAVIHHLVSSRRRELGIRIALGATGARILRLVARPAVAIVGGGTVVGLLAAYLVSSLLQSWMFGVEALDLASYGGAIILVAIAAVAACVLPAKAALSADPIATLREE